jgi:uncharacterized OB-fold protein
VSEQDRIQLPTPGWEPLTEGYWLAAGEGRLVVQRCGDCGKHRWPPAWTCYSCQSTKWDWAELPGTGTVFTYTWADQRAMPDSPLYNISVIELDGTEGAEAVRLMTRVVDVDKDSLRVGLPVEVTFEPLDDEVAVPFFTPRAS